MKSLKQLQCLRAPIRPIYQFTIPCTIPTTYIQTINNHDSYRRYASSKSSSKAKRILNIFRQKSIWEEPKPDQPLEVYDMTARKLKEMAFGQQPEPNELSQTILLFINQCPDRIIPLKYIPVIESSMRALIELCDGDIRKAMKVTSINKVFAAITSSSTFSSKVKVGRKASQSISTSLYGILYTSKVNSTKQLLENGLLYAKYIRSQGMVLESVRLITNLITQHKDSLKGNSDFLMDMILCVKDYNPDIDSITTIFQTLRGNGIVPEITVYHEAIIAVNSICTQDPRGFMDAFETFMNDIIIVDMTLHRGMTEETVILILDSCLTMNSINCGQRALRTLSEFSLDFCNIEDKESRLQYYELLLMACTKFGQDLSFGSRIVDKILSEYEISDLAKETWDVLAQWTTYRSSDTEDLLIMLNKMEEAQFSPDISTLNAILSVAVGNAKRTNSYIDECVSYFTKKLSVSWNVETYSYLIDRSLKSHENNQAVDYFNQSLESGCQWNYNNGQYISTLDRLLVILATARPVDAKATFKIYQRARLFTESVAYETQVALIKMMLDHGYAVEISRFLCDELANGDETLRPRVPYQQISLIYQALYDYMMSSSDNYKVLWQVYGSMNKYIALPHESYLPILERFCRLGRPDAALLIFKYMRIRNQREGLPPPGSEIYVLLFNCFGKHKFEDGVLELYNFYKMDLGIEPNIQILNSVLNAFHLLDSSMDVAMIWDLIQRTSEPNQETISIMIKEIASISMADVETFWIDTSKRFGIAPSKENVRQYLIANCKHGYFMRALEITKNMEKVYGIEPDEGILETLYNWTVLENRKENIQKWALQYYPSTWKALEEGQRLKHSLISVNNENVNASNRDEMTE